MRNIRLPELDKNRNVDQQKALVFESKTCKYDVILGADFLIKTGIDVKYSTRTIEWFENELPIRDPYSLTDKDCRHVSFPRGISTTSTAWHVPWSSLA